MIEVDVGVVQYEKDGCISVTTIQGCGCCGDSFYHAVEGTEAAQKYPHMTTTKEKAIQAVEDAKLALLQELKDCDEIIERLNNLSVEGKSTNDN